jgi:hypothetical protein
MHLARARVLRANALPQLRQPRLGALQRKAHAVGSARCGEWEGEARARDGVGEGAATVVAAPPPRARTRTRFGRLFAQRLRAVLRRGFFGGAARGRSFQFLARARGGRDFALDARAPLRRQRGTRRRRLGLTRQRGALLAQRAQHGVQRDGLHGGVGARRVGGGGVASGLRLRVPQLRLARSSRQRQRSQWRHGRRRSRHGTGDARVCVACYYCARVCTAGAGPTAAKLGVAALLTF